ncbi:MAG: hypothetical protein ACFCUX_06140 [Candidatus Methylacidiphilales bacterium]
MTWILLVGAAGISCGPSKDQPLMPEQSLQHVGQIKWVRGKVMQCGPCRPLSSGRVKACLDAPCGEEHFAAIIEPHVFQQTGLTHEAFEGLIIRVHGTITTFQNRPEILVSDPSQLLIEPGP